MNPSSRIKLVKGLAKILLVYKVVFNTPLDSSGKVLNCIRITLIVFKILFWTPFSKAFNFSRFRDTISLEVGNCLIFFIESSTNLFNSGVAA